jgi:hypothetical protein
MKKNLTPHLLISIPDSLLLPTLRETLSINSIVVEQKISQHSVYILRPVFCPDRSVNEEATALKYYNAIQVTACYLARSQFCYRITNMRKLYHPSYPNYHYYVQLENLALFNDQVLLAQYPDY